MGFLNKFKRRARRTANRMRRAAQRAANEAARRAAQARRQAAQAARQARAQARKAAQEAKDQAERLDDKTDALVAETKKKVQSTAGAAGQQLDEVSNFFKDLVADFDPRQIIERELAARQVIVKTMTEIAAELAKPANLAWLKKDIIEPVVTGRVTGAAADAVYEQLATAEAIQPLRAVEPEESQRSNVNIVWTFGLSGDISFLMGVQGVVGIALGPWPSEIKSCPFGGVGMTYGVQGGGSVDVQLGFWSGMTPKAIAGTYTGIEFDVHKAGGASGGVYFTAPDYTADTPLHERQISIGKFQGLVVNVGGGLNVQAFNLAFGTTYTW